MAPKKLLRHVPGRWAGQPSSPWPWASCHLGGTCPTRGRGPAPAPQVGSASQRPGLLPGAREAPSAFSPNQGPWEPACGVSGRGAVARAPAGQGETEGAGAQLPSPAPSAAWVVVAGGGGRCGLCWPVAGLEEAVCVSLGTLPLLWPFELSVGVAPANQLFTVSTTAPVTDWASVM